MKLKINLTVNDLRNAHGEEGQHNAYSCPIGQALQRMGWEPNVFQEQITIFKNKDFAERWYCNGKGDPDNCECYDCTGEDPETPCLIAKTTPEVKRFIERFDEGKFVKPISIELDFEPAMVAFQEDGDFDR